MSLLFVHQIAKYISKDNCGLHEPLAGSQAKSNNRDGKKKQLPYIIYCIEHRQESDVLYMCHIGVFKGLEVQQRLLQSWLQEALFYHLIQLSVQLFYVKEKVSLLNYISSNRLYSGPAIHFQSTKHILQDIVHTSKR